LRKNSIKNTRVNIEVQRALSTLINRELKDPRINSMTTIVATEVAPNLKTAKIYISVLGDEDSKESTLKGLKSASSFLRGQLARELNLRHTPELTFIIDSTIEYGVNISKLIEEVNKNKEVSEEIETEDDFSDGEDGDI